METGIARHGSPEANESLIHRGTNQSGMRDHNERLVLSLVRRHGSLAKSDIARMTGLSRTPARTAPCRAPLDSRQWMRPIAPRPAPGRRKC